MPFDRGLCTGVRFGFKPMAVAKFRFAFEAIARDREAVGAPG